MIEWDYIKDKDEGETWFTEWHDIGRLVLIKKTQDGEDTLIVGTTRDAEYIKKTDTLPDAQAKAIRYMMLVRNGVDKDRLKWKI